MDFISDETLIILEGVRSFVSKYENDPQKGEILESEILNIGIKVALFYR
jgi:hypothetical protein